MKSVQCMAPVHGKACTVGVRYAWRLNTSVQRASSVPTTPIAACQEHQVKELATMRGKWGCR